MVHQWETSDVIVHQWETSEVILHQWKTSDVILHPWEASRIAHKRHRAGPAGASTRIMASCHVFRSWLAWQLIRRLCPALYRRYGPDLTLPGGWAQPLEVFESSLSRRHRQSHAYLARLLGHRRQQYRGRASHRLVARGAVQTTRAGHRLLRTVTRAVLTGAQYLRGSDRKPNRRNQRSAGTLRRAYAHHPHLAFQTGPIKRTRGPACHHKHEFETLHTSRSNRTRLTGRAVVRRSRVFARRVERKPPGLGRLRSGGATDHRRL